MIPEKLLIQFGARIDIIQSGDLVFQQEEKAQNFYQIRKGQIRVTTISDSGKEFIQGIFNTGESFGEPALFADISYPGSAQAMTQTELLVITKAHFLKLLADFPRYYLVLLNRLSLRLHYKASISQAISMELSEKRILVLIDYLKKKDGKQNHEEYKVPHTRQEIADMIGLRVETVIRSISALKQKNMIQVKAGKIIR
ncbi:MAG TPA: Crp/Fnr family transcriptional regulator [Membranihabitans sp.]|nr:Crp/Fnr family transcriptional regulator [Membranihabitans sp.]